MEATLNEILLTVNSISVAGFGAPAILSILGGLLILADYYFDTDIPAHVGYVCFALTAFLMGPPTLRESFLVGLLVWSMLLNLHFMFLREILERDIEEAPQA